MCILLNQVVRKYFDVTIIKYYYVGVFYVIPVSCYWPVDIK